ncbi:staphylococcal-like nuclease CAN2 isoform X1 [Lactuca sativa]|uniref:TNase-like domain-containing protein n=1 Tax=Lactuca sativa TaxID=4236 RepID=A0A9R1UE98_LACSA|nr:staphylococcal-like nuclease CAN2 isoform X1 [Lactuca sativa]KAJ0185647.1 hypothetical protein LSAT_V11C900481450 [Lactuca sativa]
MGNALRFLYGQCCSEPPTTTTTYGGAGDQQLGHHGVSSTSVGVSALAQHLYHFEITSQVPEGLSKHVSSSKKAQSNWYKKLSKAWRESKPPPKTPEEASRLVIRTLQRHQRPDIEGILSFYGLPLPHSLVELTAGDAPPLADGLKFELHTLPVDARAVADGDTVTVYVSTSDAPESSRVPQEVHMAAVERNEARAHKNYTKADALQKQIKDAGYGVLHINNEEILARKYRIRLRGIDAPESAMPYGKEAKDELVKIIDGKCLKILIFDEDQYGRFVGDIYCNGIFVQELMLKKGLAWHYTAYDKRPELEKWEKSARAKRIGLWASSNPEMPWEWRKNRREHR